MIRVFLLDDHEVVRAGLRRLLQGSDEIEVVGEAGTVASALHRLRVLQPDVALVDGRLPDGDGVEVCRRLASLSPSTRALVLTSFDDDQALFAALDAGAAGYLLKQVSGQDLVAAVRHVAAGGSLLDPAVTAKVITRLRDGDHDELSCLTAQERRVLELVADGLTNREVGERLFLAEKTVKNAMTGVLAKLGVERRTQAAVIASRVRQRAAQGGAEVSRPAPTT